MLHDLSFEIKSGERVGIGECFWIASYDECTVFLTVRVRTVGRTGSGKSSLTLALLRLILTEGKVYYDGIATDSVNLDALRSHVTIIPQVVRRRLLLS